MYYSESTGFRAVTPTAIATLVHSASFFGDSWAGSLYVNNQTRGVCTPVRTYCAPLFVAPYLRVLRHLDKDLVDRQNFDLENLHTI